MIMIGKPQYSGEKTLSQCCSVHHKFHVDWHGIATGLMTDICDMQNIIN
jgi:hypothetical protein